MSQFDELPEGWAFTKVGELGEIVTGSTPPKKNPEFYGDEVPFYKPTDLDVGYEVIDSREKLSRLGADRSRCLPEMSVLVTCIGATIGKTGLARRACVTNQQINAVVPHKEFVFPQWLYWMMCSSRGQKQILDNASATTLPILNKTRFSKLEFPLPPLNEQRRIVEKIEALTARSRKAREALEAIPALLDQFRQSVLAAAFRGDLTADWREQNPDIESAKALLEQLVKAHEAVGGHKKGNAAPPTENVHTLPVEEFPKSWTLTELRDLCEPGKPITYGILKPGPELEEGVKYIRVADFPGDQLNLDTIRKTSFEIDEKYSRSRLKEGDILLSIRGTVGRICRIPNSLEGANITQDSARLSIQSSINSDFIFLMLKANSTQQRMNRAIKGVAVRGINIGDVRALQFPLPPYAEQIKIFQEVHALFEIIERLEQQYVDSRAASDQLDRAILAKAFRGELVPQDPTDEPAALLLERIRNAKGERIRIEREKLKAKSKKKRSKKRTQPSP